MPRARTRRARWLIGEDLPGGGAIRDIWNSHVHFVGPKFANAATLPALQLVAQLEDMLTSRGFVHVFEIATFDLENTLALRERIRKGELTGPDIYTTRVPFVGPI
jgi:hypothetical protein